MPFHEAHRAVTALPDYHLHTPLCNHAVGEVPQYVAAAEAIGIPEICFTDHCPTPDGYDPAHRMGMDAFPGYVSTISGYRNGVAPRVLMGVETDYYPGCERFLRGWLPAHDFDLVLGSVHYIDQWGFDSPSQRPVWDRVDVTGMWRAYFELLGRLADTGLYDAAGHLDLPKKFGHRPPERDLLDMAGPALDRLARAGMGIEINTAGLRSPAGEIYPSARLLTLARERDIPICFGSDAHRPEDVGRGFTEALLLARECGYTHYFRVNRRRKSLVPLPAPASEGGAGRLASDRETTLRG